MWNNFPPKINQNDLCYRYSKDGSEFLFGNLRISDKRIEPFTLQKVNNLMWKQNILLFFFSAKTFLPHIFFRKTPPPQQP